MHLYQLSHAEGPASDGAPLVLFDEVGDVDALEDVAFDCADGVSEWREGESTAVERQFCEWYFFDIFFALPVFLHFGVGDVHFILGVPMFAHCSYIISRI
jgi:hypothetical protein